MKILSMRNALLAGGLVAMLAAFGAGKGTRAYRIDNAAYILPAAQIISYDDTVARLDTATGAVHRLRGNLDNSSVQNSWELRVGPVTGATSGLLEIQKVTFHETDETFLVDIVTGRTWVLRRRASTNGTWDEIKIYR
ncbi:MAG: hypothetical protein HKN62_05135 [Phycisphaerales bacterium]|nr:hypothetical protein [Phycisphaerales bacterium]